MDSILNEIKMDYKRGQRITYRTPRGEVARGSFVMASSADGCIVVNTGGRYGVARVVNIRDIIK